MPTIKATGKDANYITFKRAKCIITDWFNLILQNDINQALPIFPAIKTGFVYYPAQVSSWSLITSGTRWENTLFTSIQSRLICQLGQAEWSSGKAVHLLKATGVLYDFKPQSQVVLQQWGKHTEETVERNLGLKEKGAIWQDRLDQKDMVVG